MKRIVIPLLALFIMLSVLPAAALGSPPLIREVVAEDGWDSDLVDWSKDTLPPDQIKATLKTPEGVEFVSYSSSWDEKRLNELYDALKQMLMGEEVRYLSKVVISNEFSLSVSGAYFPAYYIRGSAYDLAPGRIITIYNPYRAKEEIVATLTHEYGHHFTYYWLTKAERKLPNDPTTGWASLRKLDAYPIRWKDSTLEYAHEWMPQEIMADEYAVLFGPPMLRENIVGTDKDTLLGRIENDVIPLPDNEPRIRSYWLNLSGHTATSASPLRPPVITSIDFQPPKEAYIGHYDYILKFVPATDDPARQMRIRYVVRWKHRVFDGQSGPEAGVTEIRYAYRSGSNYNGLFKDPEYKGYFAVYAYDPDTGQFVKSEPLWYDVTDRAKPVVMEDPYVKERPTLPMGERFLKPTSGKRLTR